MSSETHLLADDGRVPNNPSCALIVHRAAVDPDAGDPARAFEALFAANGWPPAWANGIFSYHHYHSNAHEALGIASGSAQVQFGGASGPIVEVEAGDAVVIPAGVGHKRVASSPDLLVIGAYPDGSGAWDVCRDDPAVIDAARARIAAVPTPAHDPVLGDAGLTTLWR